MEAAPTEAIYVYGVLSAGDEAPASTGIGGAQLKEITSNGLAALVSEMPPETEHVLGREEMTTHARVLEEALTHGTVLPRATLAGHAQADRMDLNMNLGPLGDLM